MKRKLSVVVLVAFLFSIFGGYVANALIYYEPAKVIKDRSKVDLNKLVAKSAIVMDVNTGTRIVVKNVDKKLSIASLTKVMAMLIIMDSLDSGKIKMSDKVTVSENAYLTEGSQVWLEPGEVFTVEELLDAVAIHSANDAVVALAEYVAGSENAFVQLMNERAKQLGCTNTKFIDCNGLHDMKDGHYSTANDMAKISMELITKHPKILEITSIWQKMFRKGPHQVLLENTNKLVKYYDGTIGLKTGWTEDAGHNLIQIAKRDNKEIMVLVFGYQDTNYRFAETLNLLDDAFSNYSYVTKAKKDEVAGKVVIADSPARKYECKYTADALVYIRNGNENKVTAEFKPVANLAAPISKTTVIGLTVYKLNGKVIRTVNFYPEADIPKANFFQMIFNWFAGLFGA